MASVAYNGSMYSLISGEEDDGMLGEGCVEPDMSAEEVVRLLLSPVDYENEYEHHRYNLLSDLLNGLQPDDVVSEEWVMQFVDNEGIQILLAKLLEISKRYDKEDMTIFATLVPLSSVLRSLIGYQAFLQFFIARASDPEVIGVTAKVMMSNSLMCRREVVHLLTNMMIEESSSVQFVTKVYSLINRTSLNTFPFQPLVEDFGLHMGDIEYLAELLAFINAFILCEGHYEGRMKQREAFIKAGLIDIFESDDFQAVVTNSTKNIGETSAAEALKIQLDFFEQQMADDETLALEPLQTILMQLLNSEISTETKIILNNFQQISETYADGQSDFLKLFFQTLVQLSQDFARCDNPEELIARINKGSSGNKITASANEKGANVETEEKKENDDEVTSNKKSASRMSLLVNLLSDAINDEDAKKELNRQQNEEQMDPVFPNQDISRRIKELRSPMFRTRHSFIGGDSKSIFSDLVTTLQCNYSDSAEGLSEDDIRNRAASLSRLWELRMRRGTESSEIRDQSYYSELDPEKIDENSIVHDEKAKSTRKSSAEDATSGNQLNEPNDDLVENPLFASASSFKPHETEELKNLSLGKNSNEEFSEVLSEKKVGVNFCSNPDSRKQFVNLHYNRVVRPFESGSENENDLAEQETSRLSLVSEISMKNESLKPAVPKQDLPTMQQKFRNCFFRDVAMQTEEPHLLIDSESQLVQEKTEDIFQAKSDLEMEHAPQCFSPSSGNNVPQSPFSFKSLRSLQTPSPKEKNRASSMLEQASDDLSNKHTQNLNSFRNKSFNHHEFSPVDITEKRHQFGLKYRNSIRKLSSSMFPIRDGKFIVSLEASAENTPVSTRWKKPIGLSQLNDSTSESISKSFNVIARDGSIESRKIHQDKSDGGSCVKSDNVLNGHVDNRIDPTDTDETQNQSTNPIAAESSDKRSNITTTSGDKLLGKDGRKSTLTRNISRVNTLSPKAPIVSADDAAFLFEDDDFDVLNGYCEDLDVSSILASPKQGYSLSQNGLNNHKHDLNSASPESKSRVRKSDGIKDSSDSFLSIYRDSFRKSKVLNSNTASSSHNQPVNNQQYSSAAEVNPISSPAASEGKNDRNPAKHLLSPDTIVGGSEFAVTSLPRNLKKYSHTFYNPNSPLGHTLSAVNTFDSSNGSIISPQSRRNSNTPFLFPKRGLTTTKFVESCLISGPVKVYPIWVRHSHQISQFRNYSEGSYLDNSCNKQATLVNPKPESVRKSKKYKDSKSNPMFATLKETLKTPKGLKRKKNKGQKGSNAGGQENTWGDWPTPTPSAKSSFAGNYANSSNTPILVTKVDQNYFPQSGKPDTIRRLSYQQNNFCYESSLPRVFGNSLQPKNLAYRNSVVTTSSAENEGQMADPRARTKRSGSFSKVKKLFTKRPLTEYEKKKMSNEREIQNDFSTMSRPFYITGLDDLTIVKDDKNCSWAIEKEPQNSTLTNSESKPQSTPENLNYVSSYGTSLNGSGMNFSSGPETDI